jgi:hypothetical protein
LPQNCSTGYGVAVLDISQAAIASGRDKLGDRVEWAVADVTAKPVLAECDVWHDRAVFHFLTEARDRAAYVALLRQILPEGRHAVIATFTLDGPEKCSGLPVRRYDGRALQAELGPEFRLMKSVPETHVTPWGKPQSFQYSVFQRGAFEPAAHH